MQLILMHVLAASFIICLSLSLSLLLLLFPSRSQCCLSVVFWGARVHNNLALAALRCPESMLKGANRNEEN